MANDLFNRFATTPLTTGLSPDPRSFWDITPLLKTQAMWQQNIIDANKRYDNTIAEISKSTDPTNLLKNLNSSNLSSSAKKQKDDLEDYKKKLEEQRKKAEKEEKDRIEAIRKQTEETHKRLLGDTKKSEKDVTKLENARQRRIEQVARKIASSEDKIANLESAITNANVDKGFTYTTNTGEKKVFDYATDTKATETLKNNQAKLEREKQKLAGYKELEEFYYSDYFENHYARDRDINFPAFKREVLGQSNTSSVNINVQEEMPDEIKEVINGTGQNEAIQSETESKKKSTGRKQNDSEFDLAAARKSDNVYDLTTEEGKKRALEDRKKEPKKQPSKLTEYEETHRDLVEKSKADPNGVYIIDINNPSFLTGGKKQKQVGDRLASNRIEDLPNGTVVAYQGEVIRITGGDKIYGLETRKPKYDTPYEANTGNARSQKAQQDEIINSLPSITKQVEVDDNGYIIPEGDVRSGTGTITEVEDSLSNYADIGSAEWEEMGDMERKDKAQEFLNYFGKRLLEAQKENPEVFTNERIKQLLAEKKAQFDENIRLYLEENSDNLAEDVGNVARDLAISTINFFDEGMAGIADVFGMNTVAEFFYRGAEDISEFKSKEQKRKDKNYQYLKAKYEKQFGNGLIDSAKAAILAADESDNLINTLRDSLVPSLLFMGGGAGALSKGSGFIGKNASKIATVGIMGASGAGSAGSEVRNIKDLALKDEKTFNNFLEAYKKRNGEKAYNALIERAIKNGKLDKEELFNILQSKAARIGGGLSATVGLISSSLGGDVETGLINRFVLGNAAARGAVGKLTAFKLAGNIASSMANEGAEEAAETMSQNTALRFTADPEREITEGVGEATALGIAGGVIGGSLEYMGDRSARREQQRLEQQQNQNQQTDEFEAEDNPIQEEEGNEVVDELKDAAKEELKEAGDDEEQEEEQKKLEQKQEEEGEEDKKEDDLRKKFKKIFEPKGSFEEWLKQAEASFEFERASKANTGNLTDAQVREDIQWIFDEYIDNDEVLGHLSEEERKRFNEMVKTQFGLNTNPFVVVNEPTNAEKFWTEPNNPIDVSPDIANAMAVSEGMGFNFNADDEAYFQHMANVLNDTLVNNEEWNKATNTKERRDVLQKALDAELNDAQDIDEDKKNEMKLILSVELLANGAREFDKQTEQNQTEEEETKQGTEQETEEEGSKQDEETPKQTKSDGKKQENKQEEAKPVEIEDHLGKKEETPKQTEEDDNSLPPKLSDEDMLTLNGLTLAREKEIRDIVDKIPIDNEFIQKRAVSGADASTIAEEMLGTRFLQYRNEFDYARNLLEEKVKDVLFKKKSDGKKQETKQETKEEKSNGIKRETKEEREKRLSKGKETAKKKRAEKKAEQEAWRKAEQEADEANARLAEINAEQEAEEREEFRREKREERWEEQKRKLNIWRNFKELADKEKQINESKAIRSEQQKYEDEQTAKRDAKRLAEYGKLFDEIEEQEKAQAEEERLYDEWSGKELASSYLTHSKAVITKNINKGLTDDEIYQDFLDNTEQDFVSSVEQEAFEKAFDEGIKAFRKAEETRKRLEGVENEEKTKRGGKKKLAYNIEQATNPEKTIDEKLAQLREEAKQAEIKAQKARRNSEIKAKKAEKRKRAIEAKQRKEQNKKDRARNETLAMYEELFDKAIKQENANRIRNNGRKVDTSAIRNRNLQIAELFKQKETRENAYDSLSDTDKENLNFLVSTNKDGSPRGGDNAVFNSVQKLLDKNLSDKELRNEIRKTVRSKSKTTSTVNGKTRQHTPNAGRIEARTEAVYNSLQNFYSLMRGENPYETNATETTEQSEETSGERTGEQPQGSTELGNDEQGTTGDVSTESAGDTSQGQGSTESNQTDTSTETSNSTGGTSDQTGQGENTLNEGSSSEIEDDNRQAESEGDTDKKSKGRKSTKSTNTKSKKNTTGGRKSRTEETERNSNDRGGETVAEERVEENAEDAYFKDIRDKYGIRQQYINNLIKDERARRNGEKVDRTIEQAHKILVDSYLESYAADLLDGNIYERESNKQYKDYIKKARNEVLKVVKKFVDGDTMPTAEKTARQQLNDLGFTDNEIDNLTADLTSTLNEDEVKKAARKKGIRAKKKLDEVVELFNQDIRDRIDSGNISFDEDEDIKFSIRTDSPPDKKGIGYKVFVLKQDKKTGEYGLYPPMVANADKGATPLGVWLNADDIPISGTTKTGRPQVKAGGKGTQGSTSGNLAYRPGWHLGEIPYAIQFNRENGTKFPNNFVWAEVEYANDINYQEEARQEGINKNGKYQHSLAGLKRMPVDGSYKYRTNPNPETGDWIITGAMKVNKILTKKEVDDLVIKAGKTPQTVQEGSLITDDVVNELNRQIQEIQNENDATRRNDEQQGNLGGNQSAETRAENDNQENSTQSNNTTPNEPTRNGNGKTRQRKAKKQKIIKSITGFSGEINDTQSTANPAELKASIENELRNTFGEETAGQVQVMTLEELRKTQPKTADSVEKYNVRGFYKPKSGQVVIIADHFAGLSPKEASLVAFHELGHKTMGAKRAEWDNELARLSSNKTISKIKDKLKQIEGYKNLNDVELTEEVMADLFAAHQSGDWNSFADKYGVRFSKDLTGEAKTLYERFKDFIKNFFGYGENEQVSDREVRAALGKLSLEFNGETEADLNSQEKSIADVNSYIEQVRNGQAQDERISALVEQGLSDEDIVKDLFGELADADAEGKTYKSNLPENISNAIQNAWNGIKNTVSTVALGTATWVGTNLGMSQDVMAQDFNYSNPTEFESQVVKKIVDTNDHLGETFAVVNKQNGSLTIYDRNGNQIATTPVLYGKKVGDSFSQNSRGITPSGRFNLEYTTNINNQAYGKSAQILTQNGKWLGNDSGNFAIHRTYTGFPNENRPARLASKTPADNKISLGCINVPPAFYDAHFENNQFGNMPLYVLPETPAGRTGIFSNQPSKKPATPKGKGDPSKGKPYSPSYMQYMGDNPFAAARGVETGEVKNAELEGLTSTYKELNQINIGDRIAQDPTDRQDVLTTGFKDGLSSASMVTYNYGSEPDFNEETEDDPRLTPSERLANGDFDSMPIQRGVREDSTEDDDIYKASIGIVGGLEVALATKGVINAVETTKKRKSTGAKKLLPSQAPNQQYIDIRRKAWQNHIRQISDDIDPETIDKKTGVGKKWTQARLDEIADLYFSIDDFNDSFFDASSYKQSRTGDFDTHRTWGNNRFLRAIFRIFGGATPAFDNALGRQNIKRFGYEADASIPSVHFSRIKALTNGAMGHLQRSYLRPLYKQTTYLAQDLGKSTKQIRQDAGELATIDHILSEGADHFFRGLDLAIREARGKVYELEMKLLAARNAGNIKKYDKISAQIDEIKEEIRKLRIERVRSYRIYKGKDPDNGRNLLPGGYTEQILRDKRTAIENKYGNDISRLEKHSKEIVDTIQKVRNFGATNGVFGADSLNTIQKLGFTNYVPLYTNPTENESLELDFDKPPFEVLHSILEDTSNNIRNLGLSNDALRNILGNGTTRDFTSYGRIGSTSQKQALNAYENLETFAQKVAARTGTIPFAQSVQQLFEGTVGESMQSLNKNTNYTEYNSRQKVDHNGNPLFDKNGNPLMENLTMKGGNSKFKGLLRFPSDLSQDWKQMPSDEDLRQLEIDLGMKRGDLGTPSELKTRLASLQPIRAKGYNAEGELKNYDYYFIEPQVSNEINQNFNHLAQSSNKFTETAGGKLIADVIGAGTKLESKLMTSYNLVWNAVNFTRDSLERWSIMINRPVMDKNGNLVSKWDLTKTYENNLAKLVGSPTKAMPEIYRYLTENEVKTELQRQLQEAVRGGGIQLLNDLLRKDSSIILDAKNENIEKALKHMEHWINTGVNKIGNGGIRNTLKEVNTSYIAAFVEVPQVISALAAYQTYQQLGVNKQESLNRTRDMFDPLRTRNTMVAGVGKYFPFVRATLSGHYNLIRTLTQYWKPGEAGFMSMYLLGGTASAYALYALAAGFMGDDDDGVPLIAKMSIQQLMQGIPIPAYKKGFFSIPTGFGINKVFSSLAAILYKKFNGQLSAGDAFKATFDLIFENTTPLKAVHTKDGSLLRSALLSIVPFLLKTPAESLFGYRSNGSKLYKVQRQIGQKHHQVDDFTVPEGYKTLAKIAHDYSGGFLDFNPETLELFADNVFQGPLKVIPQNLMQDRSKKTLGHETTKGEFIGLALNLIGAGILSSPTAFEDWNTIYNFQRLRVGIQEEYNVNENAAPVMTSEGDISTEAKLSKLDSTENIARQLLEKGCPKEAVYFVVNDRNFFNARNNLNRDLRKYLNLYYRSKDPTARAIAKERAEDLYNRMEGLTRFYLKNASRSWYELLSEFNEGSLDKVLQSAD